MKSKILKSYNSYKEQHIKENMMSLANTSNVPKFDESDENLEDIKEDSEEVDGILPDASETPKIGLGTEEEKKIDVLAKPVVIAHVEIETEITTDLPETLPISEPVNTDGFNPNQNTEGFPTVSNASINMDSPKLFSIVKIMTQNGEKIGLCYTEEVGDYGTPIHNNIDFNSGCELVKQCCSEHGVEEFRNDNDKVIGLIPTFMIPKKNKLGTSYRPN